LHDEMLSNRKEMAPDMEIEGHGVLATQLHLDSEVQKTLTCCLCGAPKNVYERFRDFSLDFPAKTATAVPGSAEKCELSTMLANYFSDERLEVKCACEDCAGNEAYMSKQLTQAPRVLVLHLKRFVPNLQKQMFEKQHQRVDIPSKLDLKSCLRKAYAGSCADASRSSLPARPLAADATRWEVNIDGDWKSFDVEEGRKLETAYAQNQCGCCTYEARGQSYEVDFSDMDQRNKFTGTTRPLRRLNMESTEDVGRGPQYHLRSIVSHDGASPHSGHYVCYARGPGDNGTWKCYDDSIVKEVQDPTRSCGQKAYILFYVLQQQ